MSRLWSVLSAPAGAVPLIGWCSPQVVRKTFENGQRSSTHLRRSGQKCPRLSTVTTERDLQGDEEGLTSSPSSARPLASGQQAAATPFRLAGTGTRVRHSEAG